MSADFTKNLLKWHLFHNNREMPWKGEPDPYRIWLSEIILQQTRVEQGRSYYLKFIEKFPDVHSLANAADEDVYKLWEGLGYYSRCRNLIATARIIRDQHNGFFPSTYNEIINLKGIGPYTAAAISSFAFNEKRAVVDGNVQRVLSRFFGVDTPVDTTTGKKFFEQLASKLIDEHHPAAYNQAIMDFGATVCKPRNPLCTQCIQQTSCVAFRENKVDQLPVKQKQMTVKNRWLYYFIIENDDVVYVRRRSGKDIWQNLYEFVLLEASDEQEPSVKCFLDKLLQHQPYTITSQSDVQAQQLTHQRIRGRFISVKLYGPAAIGDYRPVKKNNLNEYAFPRFINAFLEREFYKEQLNS